VIGALVAAAFLGLVTVVNLTRRPYRRRIPRTPTHSSSSPNSPTHSAPAVISPIRI
jgi:hypothetical protein